MDGITDFAGIAERAGARNRLQALNISDVYEPGAGALQARARLPQLPPEPPVTDLHALDEDRQPQPTREVASSC